MLCLKLCVKIPHKLVALLFFTTGLILATSSAIAHNNKVVVIPMSGGNLKQLENVISVAKKNGDFSDPVAALASISDASINNPYIVVIAPGVYTLPSRLDMKEFVDVTGSGENVTRLVGVASSNELDDSCALVSLAENSTLSSLTVENTIAGGNSFMSGIYSFELNETARLYNVTATVIGAGLSTVMGVFNNSSSPSMTDVAAIALGSERYNIGVFNLASSAPAMIHITATGKGGDYAIGINNNESSPTISDSVVTASDANTENRAIFNESSSFPLITNTNASASGVGLSYGVLNSNNSSATIRRSTLYGTLFGLDGPAIATQSSISNSNGVNVVGVGSGCVACDDGRGHALDGSCN
jgi:hypothetical protein